MTSGTVRLSETMRCLLLDAVTSTRWGHWYPGSKVSSALALERRGLATVSRSELHPGAIVRPTKAGRAVAAELATDRSADGEGP